MNTKDDDVVNLLFVSGEHDAPQSKALILESRPVLLQQSLVMWNIEHLKCG